MSNRYYISNVNREAREFYRYLRGHWSIENRLHWRLDMVFREDAALVTKGHAPENLNILRKMALALLRAAPEPRFSGKKRKMTGPKKQYTAAMDSDYMCTLLLGKQMQEPCGLLSIEHFPKTRLVLERFQVNTD